MLELFREQPVQYHALHHDMEPMQEFSLEQFRRNAILPAYMHDGSETASDKFELKVTDGTHTVRRSLVCSLHFCVVHVFYMTIPFSVVKIEGSGDYWCYHCNYVNHKTKSELIFFIEVQ